MKNVQGWNKDFGSVLFRVRFSDFSDSVSFAHAKRHFRRNCAVNSGIKITIGIFFFWLIKRIKVPDYQSKTTCNNPRNRLFKGKDLAVVPNNWRVILASKSLSVRFSQGISGVVLSLEIDRTFILQHSSLSICRFDLLFLFTHIYTQIFWFF